MTDLLLKQVDVSSAPRSGLFLRVLSVSLCAATRKAEALARMSVRIVGLNVLWMLVLD